MGKPVQRMGAGFQTRETVGLKTNISIAWQQQPTSQKVVYDVTSGIINRKKDESQMKDGSDQMDE
jgi:hypothetical protein